MEKIPEFTDDLNIISRLSDSPNTGDMLDAQDLKEKFDEAGLAIQKFLNEVLVPAINDWKPGDNSGADSEILVYGVADDGQIYKAIMTGRMVYCLYNDLYYLPLMSWDEGSHTAIFGGCYDSKIITCTAEAGKWSVKNMDISAAIDYALWQAKESGEFDGEDGVSPTVELEARENGIAISVSSYQPGIGMAGATYLVKHGKDGENGQPGEAGVSATHSWNGTTLTVTSASGTSSANLKGEKGDKGDKGDPGKNGADGYTPVKGVDYFDGQPGADGKDGADGQPGADGKDGVSATHSFNGTVLTVTSASGTSSADLKGEKGDKGDKGDTGPTGATGKPAYQYAKENGYTGTETEFGIKLAKDVPAVTQEAGQSETLVMSQKAVTDLVADALKESSKTEYETVDSVEEMTDTSKSYVLKSTGTIWTYGEVTVTKEPENKLVASKTTLNSRMSGSSGSVSAATGSNGSFVTDYIAVTDYASATPYNVRLNWEMQDSAENKVVFFNAGKTRIGNTVLASISIANGQTVVDIKTPNATGATMPTESDVAYIRLQLFVKPSGTALVSSDLDGLTIKFDSEKGTITENRWYDTGMTPENASGGGNYVDLLVKVNQNAADISEVSTRVAVLESGSETMTVPSFWQDAVEACISKIKALQVGKNCVTFPFFSDNHQRNGYAGVLIAKVMQECHIPYCFYGGDSISSGTIANEAEMIAQDKAFDTIMSYVPNGRLCRAVGNHDGYWYDGTNRYTYTRQQVYELFLREESTAQNKHYGPDGTYYYVEDLASCVRFVVLNTNGGEVDILQLAWLRDTALKPAAGWEVVLITHQPLSNHYHSNISNVAEVLDTITESGADIIGCFSGHIHRDRIYTGVATNTTDDSQGTAMGFTQVTITSDHTGIAYDDATKHTVANDDQSHAIDFVTINRNTRTVNLTRLGIGQDRSFSY